MTTLNETSLNATSDVAKASEPTGGTGDKSAIPSSVDNLEPTPVADFERRMSICRAMHVSHLKDGKLEVIFRPEPRPQPSVDEMLLRMRQQLDSEGG